MKKSIIILIVVALIAIWGISKSVGFKNNMVTMDENVNSQWAQVENVYQRRSDLIPNLVNTVKGYAEHEKATLTGVIEARAKATSVNITPGNLNAAGMKQFQAAQDGLSSALSRLMVSVERYPELKANQNFMNLQAQLEGTENRIAVERKKFNETSRQYNIYIQKFPNSFFAGLYGYQKKAYFESTKGAEKAPEVKF
ncbi:LemA protein [Ancylomarina subtilis]|uniref:LemA protein n=1 Tax=Ancylomarina subtilis TaxID=1639035 RepID=A0A4Q7VC36_9BACT|nr:LemA family protein [Ancylomarina subtilis]RZT93210.1 LemA protein [Ancylomarina subtilis]